MAFSKDFIVKNGLVVQTTATVLSTIITTSTNSGALVVTGGVGIGQNLWVGSTVTVALTSTSISTSTGALQVRGGVGIAGSTYIGGLVTVNNTLSVVAFTGATSTNTGALVVQGGAGVWQNLYVGGNLTVSGVITGSFSGSINTATNLAGGTAGQLNYQLAPGLTAFAGPGTAGQILVSAGTSAPVYTNTASIYVGAATFAATAATATVAATAVNLAGGATGSIPYQSSTGTTNFIGISSTSGYVLTSAGSTATWSPPSSISAGTATNSTNVSITDDTATTTPQFVTFVNVNSGPGGIRTSASKLSYIASTGVLATQNMFVTGSGASTSTTSSNALYVAGGAYVNSLYVRNDALFAGNVTFNGTSTYVYSTNTVYTDNIIELHTPPGGVNAQWQLDDGKDIGLRIHYYANGTDTNAALVLDNSTKELHWYSNGAEASNGDFSTATFGAFRTGSIVLTSSTNATTTQTGALQVAGGVGIGRDLVVGGNLTVAGSINATINGVITTATTVAVTNDNASATPQFIVFSAASSGFTGLKTAANTGMTYIPSSGQLGIGINTPTATLHVGGTAIITGLTTVTNTTTSISTTSGALVVAGGIGSGPHYATSLFDNNNRVVTQVNPVGGTAIGISAITNIGTATTFTVNNFGVTAAVGTTYLGVSATTGSVTFTNLGVQTLTAGTDTAVSASTGTITVWNTANLQSVTNRGSTTTNAIAITNATVSNTTTNGALTVAGGVGILGNLNVGGTITGVFIGSVTTSSNIVIVNDTSTTAVQYVTFVSTSSGSAQIKTDATSGLTFIPSSNSLGINVVATSTNYKLDVGGEIRSGVTGQGFYNTTLNSGYWWNNSGLRFDGFYFDTTNNRLSFRKGNTDNVMIIDSNNNIGMGTVAPTVSTGYTTLSVGGVTGGQVTFQNGTTLKGFAYNDATNMNVGSQAALIFMAGGATEGGRFDSSRNFMVNTVTAQSKVTVLGGTIVPATASSYALALGNVNANDVTFGSDGSYGYIQTWNSKALQINNQGNNVLLNVLGGSVGVGTASPGSKLHVVTAATGTDGIYVSSSVGGGNAYFRPNNSSGTNNGIVQAADAGIIYSSAAGIGTGAFVIAPWASATSGIRLDNNGNLAIGTATPLATLTVNGGVYKTGITTATNSTNATSTNTGALQVAGGAGIGRDLWVGGNINVAGTINASVSGVSSSATNIAITNDNATASPQYLTFTSASGGYNTLKVAATTGITFTPSTGALQNSGAHISGGGMFAGSSSTGVTRGVLSSNGDLNSFFLSEATARVQLGRDIGVSGGAGLALGGTSYALIGTGDTAGTSLYFKVLSATSAVTTSPQLQLTNATLSVNQTTLSNTSTTGALVVQGGVGIRGALSLGGPIYAGGTTGTSGQLLTSNGVGGVYWSTVSGGGGGGASVTVSDTPPVSPSAGNLWFDSTIGQMFIYYSDGDSSQWVPSNPSIAGPSGSTGPQGIQGPTGPAGVNTGTDTAFLITNSTQAVSTITGALQVRGGVGIGGNLYQAGIHNILIPTNATSTSTGALIVRGGAGFGSDLWAGALYSQSAVYAVGNIFANYSDIRLKDIQGKIEDPITKVCSIDTFYYTPNQLAIDLGVTELQRQIGVSAQSVQAVMPEAVAPSPLNKDYLTVQYERLVPLLIESIKQHQLEIQQLKEQVTDLQNRVK